MDEPVDLSIHDLTYGGAGIGRLKGLAVFVPGTVPGDLARVRLRARKPNYAEGALIEVVRPSPERITPRCLHFGACGGCQWMSLPYERQLLHKATQVWSALARIGKLDGFARHEIVPSPQVFGYRNRMEFAFGRGATGGLVLGLHRGDDPSIVEPIRDCHLQDPAANGLLPLFLGLIREDVARGGILEGDDARPGREARTEAHDGRGRGDTARAGLFVRRLALRKSESTGRFLAVLVTRPGAWPGGAALAQRAMEQATVLGGVVRRVVRENGDVLATETLAGEGTMREEIAGLTLTVTSGSFLQVNSRQTEALYRRAASFAAVGSGEAVLDLYCGVGAMTILIGRGARRATGIERADESVRCARANAEANGASRIAFLAADAERAATSEAAAGRRWDAVLLNPPRAGVPGQLVQSVARLGPSRIVYVSCDPATLARDLARFAGVGYRTTDVAPFDLFPHTYHVETVARLARAG